MKKVSIALEISHKFIKVALGYVQEEQVFVTFVKKYPINHLLEDGSIIEKSELIKELSKINPVVDQEYHVNQLINRVSLILPPHGLEVYRTKQMTSVVSPERIIGELDINNIYNIIRNKKLPVDNELIDIIPEAFVIDNGNVYTQAPLGKVSSAVTAHVKVHTVPRRINAEYSEVVKNANIQISRNIVSTFAIRELLASYNDMPKIYFLVDIGSDSTSVSLIGNNQLYATRTFFWGGDNITDRIVSSFNISEVEAEKIKILYGLDKRDIKFDYSVCKTETPEGVFHHHVNELNNIIEVELDEFFRAFNTAIEDLAITYKVANYRDLPIYLIGGTSRLKGIIPYLESKETYKNFTKIVPHSLGARDPSLFALLGAILVEHKYPNTSSLEKATSVTVTREE